MFNKDLEELKNKQTEMNNTITEMKTTLEGINSRITEAEEWISDLEDRMVEFTATEQNKEKRMKRNEDSQGEKAARCGGSAVMNWEIGIDMYTLMCIEWMTNKKNK